MAVYQSFTGASSLDSDDQGGGAVQQTNQEQRDLGDLALLLESLLEPGCLGSWPPRAPPPSPVPGHRRCLNSGLS